ncbi:MAG: calcium/sodium antiporter [Bacteroidales bacterium]|nr:calcium/sodium antiporter [Bacteroidales bacterium]
MILNIVYILIGLILLVKGGDFLIDGSVAIARWARLSSMVIGLTVIGFGTSMPELLVSLQAALAGNPGISIGNVVGSNITNIALILGVSAILCPLPASKSTLKIDMPFMIIAFILFVVIAMTGSVERLSGGLLFLLLVAFVTWQVRKSRKQADNEVIEKPAMSLWKAFLLVAVSLAALVFGADLLVDGASAIARDLGVADRVIGLTIVAVGTSLPELFASVMAARKGETDMAIGNIIGSGSFNVLSVIGLSAVVCPITETNVGFLNDYILMIALGFILWLFLRTKHLLERWEGILLLVIYLAFLGNTIMNAKSLVFTLNDDSKVYYQLDSEHHPMLRMTDEGLTIEANQYTFSQISSWRISEEDAPSGIEAVNADNSNSEVIRIYTADGKLQQTKELKDLPAGTYVIQTAKSSIKIVKK